MNRFELLNNGKEDPSEMSLHLNRERLGSFKIAWKFLIQLFPLPLRQRFHHQLVRHIDQLFNLLIRQISLNIHRIPVLL
jgi:hypothetical protein